MQQELTNTGVTNLTSSNYVPPLRDVSISGNGDPILPLAEVKTLEPSLVPRSLFQREQEGVRAIARHVAFHLGIAISISCRPYCVAAFFFHLPLFSFTRTFCLLNIL